MTLKQICFGDYIKIRHGFAFKSQFFRDSGKYVVLTPGHFYESGGFRDRPEKDRFYDGEFPDEFILPDHALIIAMTEQGAGLLGSSALVPEGDRYLHNQRIGLVTITNPGELDKEFLYRLFNIRSVRAQIDASASGTKVRHTAPERVYRVVVSIPKIDSQRKTAASLSSYDDFIENNHRRIRLLEEAAQLLYQEWFVRFRFPGHEHAKIIDGVPRGWSLLPLSNLAAVLMGQSPSSKFYNETGQGLPFHQGVKDYGDRFPVHRVFCTQLDRVAEPGDILFSVRAPVGRINIARDRLVIGRGLCALRSRDGRQSMLHYQLRAKFHKEDLIGTGAIYAAVKKMDLFGVELLTPPNSLAEEFEGIAAKVDREIELLTVQNWKLREARDLLLPKLMSGEVQV